MKRLVKNPFLLVTHVFELLGLRVGRPVPPVLGVGVDLALGEEELDGVEVALGRRQVQRRSPVVVAHGEVHVMHPRPAGLHIKLRTLAAFYHFADELINSLVPMTYFWMFLII